MPISKEEENALRAFRSLKFSQGNFASAGGIQKFLDSGITGGDLARNPKFHLGAARFFQTKVDKFLASPKGIVPNNKDSLFGPLVFDYYNTQQSLKQKFINEQVEKQFGPQNIISQSSVSSSGGERVLSPGLTKSTSPTKEQLDKIVSDYKTPYEVATGIRPQDPNGEPFLETTRSIADTFKSGLKNNASNDANIATARATLKKARQKRVFARDEEVKNTRIARKRVRKEQRQTILTSDADSPIGNQTILG